MILTDKDNQPHFHTIKSILNLAETIKWLDSDEAFPYY